MLFFLVNNNKKEKYWKNIIIHFHYFLGTTSSNTNIDTTTTTTATKILHTIMWKEEYKIHVSYWLITDVFLLVILYEDKYDTPIWIKIIIDEQHS